MSDQPTTPSPLAPIVSPLTEADPNSINELIKDRIDEIFNKNPIEKDESGNYILTDKDLFSMVDYYRRERHRFVLESAQKPPKEPGAKRKAPTSVKEALISTNDLL